MLAVRNLSKSFGGLRALDAVSLSCAGGEILGVIGPNGAGKSTLVNAICGIIRPDEGSVLVGEADVTAADAVSRARLGVARTFQNLRLFGDLTVRQNVEVALTTCRRHRPGAARGLTADALLEAQGLGGVAEALASSLPYGLRRRLEIARALALAPKVLLLDEPAAGLNDLETESLATGLAPLATRLGCAVVVIDHDLGFILSVSNRLCVLDMGRVVTIGPPQDVRADPRVQEIYLGAAEEATRH